MGLALDSPQAGRNRARLRATILPGSIPDRPGRSRVEHHMTLEPRRLAVQVFIERPPNLRDLPLARASRPQARLLQSAASSIRICSSASSFAPPFLPISGSPYAVTLGSPSSEHYGTFSHNSTPPPTQMPAAELEAPLPRSKRTRARNAVRCRLTVDFHTDVPAILKTQG